MYPGVYPCHSLYEPLFGVSPPAARGIAKQIPFLELITLDCHTPESTRQRLQLPICLPQTTSGYDSPFARAHNPQLEASGIEQEEFLNFLDALNIAMVRIRPVSTNIARTPSDILSRRPALHYALLTWLD